MQRLFQLTAKIHNITAAKPTDEEKKAGRAAVEQHLWDEGLMNPDSETLDSITPEGLSRIVKALEARRK